MEFAKPLMDGAEAGETRATMRWALDQCYLMLHPIMPFITEELWALTGTLLKLLVHGDWPTCGAELIDAEADREMNWVISLIDDIRSARTQMRVPVGLKLEMIQIDISNEHLTWLRTNAVIVERLARVVVGQINLTDTSAVWRSGRASGYVGAAPRGWINVPVEGAAFALNVGTAINLVEEEARLAKSLEKLEKDLGGLRGRLNNPKFVASAPEEVIDETRGNLSLGEEEVAKLKSALARLAEAM